MVQIIFCIRIIFTLIWLLLVAVVSTKEHQPVITNVRTEIVNQALIIYWTVNAELRNSSEIIQFNAKYCPVNKFSFEETQACLVNVTVCEANYTAQAPLSSTIITRPQLLTDHLINNSQDYFLTYDDRPVLLSSGWDSKQRLFTCVLHNLKPCYYDDGRKLADVLVTAPSENFTEIKEIFIPENKLKKPENISIIQNKTSVTITWYCYNECWMYTTPNDYYVILESSSSDEKRQKVVPTAGIEANANWQCTFRGVKAFTQYTVKIYGFITRDQQEGPVAQMTYITEEAAPLKAPSILCSMCNSVLFKRYRNVTVRWKLPPRESWNGILRGAVVRYWKEGSNQTTSEIQSANLTYIVLVNLRQDVAYRFKIKLCTTVCGLYSELGYIAKDVPAPNRNTDRSKVVVIAVCGFLAVVFVTIVGLLIWRKHIKRRSEKQSTLCQLSEDPYLQNGSGKANSETESASNVYNYIGNLIDEVTDQEKQVNGSE